VNARAEIPLETQTGMSDGPEICSGFGTELIEKVGKQFFGSFVVFSEVWPDLHRIDIQQFV
jgi:hypothetical protein